MTAPAADPVAEKASDLARIGGRDRTPARPGPGPIADRLVRQLELSMDRRVGGRMTGDHLGIGRGTGLELDRIRPYEPGDDVRRIDWNATARTLIPQVREDVPDRQLTAWLLLDHSPSMHFGTADRRKADVAEGAALVVGRFAARRGNRLGIVTFGAGRETVVAAGRRPPRDARPDPRRRPPNRPRKAAASPRRLARSRSSAPPGARAGVVVIVSDFRGPRDWLAPLTDVAGRHAVVALEIARPARGRARRRRRADPHRSRDRPDAPRRHRRSPPSHRASTTAATADRASLAAEFRRPRRPPPPTLHRWAMAARARARLHPNPRPNRTTRMTFLAPELLLGLLLIPVAIGFYLWAQRRRSRYAVRFTNLDLLANLAPRRPSWRRHLPPVLYLGAIAALLIGLARPTMVVAVPREDATVLLTMDVSRLDARHRRRSRPGSMPPRPPRSRSSTSCPKASASGSSRSRPSRSPSSRRRPTATSSRPPSTDLTARDGTAMGDALMQVLDIAEQIQAEDAETPDASATPEPPAAPRRSAAPERVGGPSLPTDQPSDQPLVAAILLSDGANSVGQAEPLDAARARRDARRARLHDRPRARRAAGSRSERPFGQQ